MKTVEQQLAELKLKFAEMTDCARDILSELGEAYGHASACVNRFEDRIERVIKDELHGSDAGLEDFEEYLKP